MSEKIVLDSWEKISDAPFLWQFGTMWLSAVITAYGIYFTVCGFLEVSTTQILNYVVHQSTERFLICSEMNKTLFLHSMVKFAFTHRFQCVKLNFTHSVRKAKRTYYA